MPSDDALRVNALVRGLKVLAAVNNLTNPGVADIVRASGVAKTTVLRLLATLVHEGYVACDDRGAYRVTDRVANLSRGLVGEDVRQRRVQPILDRLDDLRWPMEYLELDGLFMMTANNNRSRAAIKLERFEARRFLVTESASGIAYLAALPAEERDTLVHRAASYAVEPAKALYNVRLWLRQAHEDGFAMRVPPGLNGIRVLAIAVESNIAHRAPYGALAMVHFMDMVDDRAIEKRFLPRLRVAAEEIGLAMDQA